MSIQLIDNTLYGKYGPEGEALFNELQTLVKPKSWQLNYIAEKEMFSIIGCGPTVNKSEIEAIFAEEGNIHPARLISSILFIMNTGNLN